MSWTIRVATIADLDGIMAIEHEAFAADAWSRDMFAADLVRATSIYLVVDDGGIVRGYAGVSVLPGGGEADVLTIAVAASLRGHGAGRALLRGLIEESANRSARVIFLEVREDNAPAIALYRSEGFEEMGRRPAYYSDGTTALTMRRPLADASASVPSAAGPVGAEAVATRAESATAGDGPVVLGIETSCDETGIGIVRGTTLLANVIASSMDEHARYGGVVPEVAARAHLEALGPSLTRALDEAGLRLDDVDAVAVTAGPGLAGALMVGIGAAKSLAVAIDRPLYGVNHLVGHVGADILDRGAVTVPTIALLVSGGHTSLLVVRDLVDDVELLGETIDDAAGEAFDKVARLLGLPYPGGPHIQRAAESGNPRAVRFPRGLSLPKDMAAHRYDFSFSGLKTAVARYVEGERAAGREVSIGDTAASFQAAVIDVLVTKALAACADFGIPRLLLGGGVVANGALRAEAERRCAAQGVELRIPPLSLCTDNGAMIAALGAQLVLAGRAPSGLGFAADSTLPATLAMLS